MMVILVLGKVFFLYVDPGAGALLLQMLMAFLFGGLFFFRRIKEKIFGIFRKEPEAAVSEPQPSDASSEGSADSGAE